MADFTQEQLDTAIKTAVEKAVEPLNTSIKKLETNNTALVDEKKTAAAKADEKIALAVKEAGEAARKSGDFKAMDESWAAKFKALQDSSDEAATSSLAAINGLTAGTERKDIAASLALKGSEGIFEQIIANRIGVEMRDGKPITIYNDKNGKPSAATREEFIKELQGDAGMKPLLAGSNGSGGGSANQNGGAGDTKTVNLSEWNKMDTGARGKFSNDGGQVVDD